MQDNLGKAELLNEYFCSVFVHDNGIINEWRITPRNTSMNKVFITANLVRKFIQKLQKPGGAGPDDLPAEFFKCCLPAITYPLSVIFNISLQSGSLPSIWKCAVITPVFKKGSPSNPANYRPISLTCIACKVLESCIKEALLSYLMSRNIITRHQHGFLSKKSTSTQLLECTLDWSVAFNSKNSVDVIYLDYARAFDSVVYNKLIYKLSCYGICNMLLCWIKDFLTCRLQAVVVGSCLSSYCKVISGVPQGSVLGPVLFVLFVNDIVTCTDSSVSVKLFADDVKLYTVISDEFSCDKLQISLDNIYSWSNHWQLKLSPSKCTVLHLKSGRSCHQDPLCDDGYSIGDSSLPVCSTVSDLGISYDNHFSFRPHIHNIVAKASLRAKLILKCFVSRNARLLTKAFCVFVRPVLEFSSVVWSPYFRCDIDKIENVQRRFTKAIFPQMTYSARLSKLKLQTLEMRRIIADLTTCYKLLNGLTETDYRFALSRSSMSQTRGNSLKLNKNHLASTRDGALFHNRIINLWNALPDYIVTARSVSCFKQYLLKHVNDVGLYFFTSRYY